MHFVSHSEEETKKWAADFIRAHFNDALKPLVLTLKGEMGAGKTQVAKGVAGALGVTGVVASPTFVLTREYQGEYGKLVHIDCWRVPEITPSELDLSTYFKPGTVVVIEWPEPLMSFLKKEKDIRLFAFELTGDENERVITKIS
jgi:tRNA threonylcarbamoyladenosine biosynthesis protein TsaE